MNGLLILELHHITPLRRLLNDLEEVDKHRNNRVEVPTRNKYNITHSGKTVILKNHTLKNVLYVPDFKFNLLLVSKLTELSCSVSFYPEFCFFRISTIARCWGLVRSAVVCIGCDRRRSYL